MERKEAVDRDARDMELFLQDLDEDRYARANVNLYKGAPALPRRAPTPCCDVMLTETMCVAQTR